jgi:ABC-type sugar transport system ATPase subunit
MNILEFKNVTKTYALKKNQVITAVDQFSLNIAQGEMVVLLGPSGCGKTTLLRMISGLEQLSAGDILMDGNSIVGIPPHKRPIAMVFQNYALYPHMSAEQNLTYALGVKKIPKDRIKKRLQDCCTLLQLDASILLRKPEALSGGQRQRVALGRAIMQRPRVSLLDEPFANLDQNLRMHLRTQIRKIQKTLDLTIIMVTHDQGDALTMGDRVVLMDQGIIIQAASPQTMYHQPENLFAARFMGWPPINEISGQIHWDGHGILFRHAGGSIPLPIGNQGFTQDQRVVLCIRPEHVKIFSGKGYGSHPYKCMDVEMSGATCFVNAQRAELKISGVARNDLIRPGDPVRISFKAGSILFYDSDTRKRLDVRLVTGQSAINRPGKHD